MYEQLFNDDLAKKMTDYFFNELAPLGRIKKYDKNEILDPDEPDHVYIVTEGAFDEILYSLNGDEISFFRHERGVVFGEMDYFDGDRTCLITKALMPSAISIVSRDVLEAELMKNPLIYKEFIHSISRKFRIVMLQLADNKFNDALGKIANVLLRLVYTTGYKSDEAPDKHVVNMKMTHEELASRLSCSRITITNGLNFFKDKGYIVIEDKKIHIENIEGLREYINPVWDND